jgi:ribosome-binding factor A
VFEVASFERSDRVAEAIKREISDLLFREVKDPRVHFATVTDVEVAHDLRFVKIYVSVMGDDEAKAETMAGLEAATGFLRKHIGQRVRLRFTPEIRFYLDKSLDRAMRISELLESIKQPAGTEVVAETPAETAPLPEVEKAPKGGMKPKSRKKSAPKAGENTKPS